MGKWQVLSGQKEEHLKTPYRSKYKDIHGLLKVQRKMRQEEACMNGQAWGDQLRQSSEGHLENFVLYPKINWN